MSDLRKLDAIIVVSTGIQVPGVKKMVCDFGLAVKDGKDGVAIHDR